VPTFPFNNLVAIVLLHNLKIKLKNMLFWPHEIFCLWLSDEGVISADGLIFYYVELLQLCVLILLITLPIIHHYSTI
jgi:hypothetical protein